MNQKLSFSIDQSKREESSGRNSETKIDRAFSRVFAREQRQTTKDIGEPLTRRTAKAVI